MQTVVYIDAFNLYYGACRAPGRRWLNPLALAQRLLPNDEIAKVAYFTANIKRDPEDPGAQNRQRLYHRALQTIPNLDIFLGRYISKRVRGELVDAAPEELPRRTVLTYEEKGTDVSLATRRLLDGFNRRYESAAVISNDGDLKMPIRVVREELDLHVTVVPRSDRFPQGRSTGQTRDVVSPVAPGQRSVYWNQSPCCFVSRARGRRKAASAFLDTGCTPNHALHGSATDRIIRRSGQQVPRAGFEPAAYSLGGSRSIQLSYRGGCREG